MCVTGPQKMLFSTSSGELASSCGSTFSMSTRGCTSAGLDALAHVEHGLLEDHRRARRALQPVVVVLHGREWLRARARTQLRELVGDVVELVDRHQPVGKFELLELRLAIEREDVEGQPVLAGEAIGAHVATIARARSR